VRRRKGGKKWGRKGRKGRRREGMCMYLL